MGTVGLSFGSPTSGAGFDVSSTVSEIVTNLQNVETPWKTQLTTLESQDTAISNLGTLISSLSTDINSLTDFTGVLAQKTGSSSDTNVLELTAATSAALAGTHTVVVNSLATTSSGYLPEIADSSDTLSGAFTIQLGNGTAKTVVIGAAANPPAANTIYTGSGVNSLSGVASAINSSGLGITASVLTDATGSRLSLVSGVSGAAGNIAVTKNSLATAVANTLSYSGMAGTSSANSTGVLEAVSGPSEALSGSMTIQVGSGASETIYLGNSSDAGAPAGALATGTSSNTLLSLESFINTNSATLGVKAAIITNSDGTSSLSLTSQTAGGAGTLTINSSIQDSSTALAYTSAVTGTNASLTVDGANLTSASNTISNLIPGVTFQLLAPSSDPVQVVIGNDNSTVETTINQFVTDYNAVVSAINTQQGNTSSGTPEPLFGSPTVSLLQQQLLGSLNMMNPNGSVDSISSTNGTTLADQSQIRIEMGSGASATFIVGSGSNSAVPGNYYTDNTDAGGVDNGNTLSGLAAAINAVSSNPLLSYSGTAGSSSTTSNGVLAGIANGNDTLSGSISIQVGNGTAATVTMDQVESAEGGTTLADLESYINTNSASLGVKASIVTNSNGTSSLSLSSNTSGSAGTLTVTSSIVDTDTVGVTAGVSTANGQSTLTFTSGTSGSNGALTVTSALTANTPAALSFTDAQNYTGTTADSGTMSTIQSSSDTLTGSMTIQVGNGTAQTITLNSSNNSLSGLMDAINHAGIGVNAAMNTEGTALTLTSGTVGAAGALTVTSNIFDTSDIASSETLNYNNSSDINSLTALGISVNNDGSLTFDANTLDALLNTDYSGVLGLFQNVDSWGQSFANMLNNVGTSSSTGILKLAQNSNSSIESSLNAEISKEETYISTQKTKLTAELNQANQIMQELPSQLQGMNELYSAITGYNQNSGG